MRLWKAVKKYIKYLRYFKKIDGWYDDYFVMINAEPDKNYKPPKTTGDKIHRYRWLVVARESGMPVARQAYTSPTVKDCEAQARLHLKFVSDFENHHIHPFASACAKLGECFYDEGQAL